MEERNTRLFIDVKALATNFAQLDYFRSKFLKSSEELKQDEDDNFNRNFITDSVCNGIFWNLVYNNHPDEVIFIYENDIMSNTYNYFLSEEGSESIKSVLSRIPFPVKMEIITKTQFMYDIEDNQFNKDDIFIIFSSEKLQEINSLYITLEKYINEKRVCLISEDIGIISKYNSLRKNNIFNNEKFNSWV